MTLFEDIQNALLQGQEKNVRALIKQALKEDLPPEEILRKALLPGLRTAGDRFQENEYFIPEIMMASRAMNKGLALLKPMLLPNTTGGEGRVIIGSIKGDLHEIGKDIVALMMQSRGLQVLDLGIDVSPEAFIDIAQQYSCDIIACSSMLTTTMINIERLIELAEREGIRNDIAIMIGGAAVTEEYCRSIGGDLYAPDAISAAEKAATFCRNKKLSDPIRSKHISL